MVNNNLDNFHYSTFQCKVEMVGTCASINLQICFAIRILLGECMFANFNVRGSGNCKQRRVISISPRSSTII